MPCKPEEFHPQFQRKYQFNKTEIRPRIMNDFGYETYWAPRRSAMTWIAKGRKMFGFRSDGRYEVDDFCYNASTTAGY